MLAYLPSRHIDGFSGFIYPDHTTDTREQYDVTRKALLKGREDMLALAAAQLQSKAEKRDSGAQRNRIWVDVGFLPI